VTRSTSSMSFTDDDVDDGDVTGSRCALLRDTAAAKSDSELLQRQTSTITDDLDQIEYVPPSIPPAVTGPTVNGTFVLRLCVGSKSQCARSP